MIRIFGYALVRLDKMDRGKVMRSIFSKDELIAIENALWRRGDDDTDKRIPYNEVIKYNCKKIAKEL